MLSNSLVYKLAPSFVGPLAIRPFHYTLLATSVDSLCALEQLHIANLNGLSDSALIVNLLKVKETTVIHFNFVIQCS